MTTPQSRSPDPQASIVNRQSSIPNPQSRIARPVVSIGGRRIGANNPIYIIAEAGVNHNGDIATARRLIEVAHEAGADAVKFQVFSADRLVAPSAPACKYQKQHDARASSQRDVLRRLELDAAAFRALKTHADRLGIDFLATPFGLTELRFLVDLQVPAIKIASPDVVNVPLLTAAAKTNLPMIVSTGAADLHEIDAAVQVVQSAIREPEPTIDKSGSFIVGRLILLHCVSAYPTQPQQARLGCIRTLANRFEVPVGFSDHTPDAAFGALAVAAGAVILEKHVTLDRGAQGPDHFFSLEPSQFTRYVATAREAHEAIGDGRIRVAPDELEVRKLARGSIVTTMAITAGQALTSDQLAIQRPGAGITPAKWNDIIGRVVKTDIPPNTPLAWSMLCPELSTLAAGQACDAQM
ncbi:MAG: N-acetylneuraminate synthase family protein [Phycisphaerae bacterium]|nr:N-acetylneuraminate synthase family protein [Phycisphaerae bacterium]